MQQQTVKLLLFATTILLCVYLLQSSTAATWGFAGEAQRRARTPQNPPARRPAQAAYAKFNHKVPEHQAQKCDACHKFPTANWKEVYKGREPFEDITDYPSHASCLSCHRQQFFKGSQPAICTICHTNPGPRNSSRHPFANPSEVFAQSPKGQTADSQFEVFFPHEKHEGMFGQVGRPAATPPRLIAASWQQAAQANPAGECATCHKLYKAQGDSADEFVTPAPKDLKDDAFWLKKGTFMSSPTSHKSCFSCHSQGGGVKPEPGDCSLCHKPSPGDKLTVEQSDFDLKLATTMAIKDKTMVEKWKRRQVGRFRHEWFSHAELKCADCHTVSQLNTASGKGAVVKVLSCGGSGSGCHLTPTSEEGGALNFEIDQRAARATFQCTKCHINEGRKPIPDSHSKALVEIKR